MMNKNYILGPDHLPLPILVGNQCHFKLISREDDRL